MAKIILKSPAKINLGLRVIRKRGDGYHDIETIFQELDLFDEIELEETTSSGITIRSDSQYIPTGPENLAWRAVDLLNARCGRGHRSGGVSVNIKKRIPVSAGLGGGSSNASAVLLGLNRLWKLNLSQEELMKLAGRVGADSPFFLLGKSAFAKGRGEILRGIFITGDCYIILVNPGFGISTPWVFGKVKPGLTRNKQKNIIDDFSSALEIAGIASRMKNDLEDVVIARYPVIADIKRLLMNRGAAGALMSGSGATVFGIFLCERDARRALAETERSGWISFFTRPVYASP